MLEEKIVQTQIQNWLRCFAEQLPYLFYGVDETDDQVEKAVSYALTDRVMAIFQEDLKKCKNSSLVINLSTSSSVEENRVPDQPFFSPILQIQGDSTIQSCNHYYPTQWQPNPPLLSNKNNDNDRGGNIPVSGAYMFVYSWLQLPNMQIAESFQAISNNLSQRVKSFHFTPTTTDDIRTRIGNATSKELTIYIHLGYGLGNPRFNPFGFRPVLELRFNKIVTINSKKAIVPKVPGVSLAKNIDETYSYFYDFSSPCPPNCPEVGGG